MTGDEFAKLKQEGEMLETAEFGSNSYGTSRKAVQEDEAAPAKHRCCVLDIEMEASPFLDLPCSVRQCFQSLALADMYLWSRASSNYGTHPIFLPATSSSRLPQPKPSNDDYVHAQRTQKIR